MTPEAQRIALAEAFGWKYPCVGCLPSKRWRNPQDTNCEDESGLPDYLNDLNAIHEAEKVLNAEQQIRYAETLASMVASSRHWKHVTFDMLHATAAQRREALLRTLNKWTD